MAAPSPSFRWKAIAIPVFGPSLLFGVGEGAILPVVALSARDLGGSVSMAALVVTLLGLGSLVSNIPASLITTRYGERGAIVGAGLWASLGMLIAVTAAHLAVFALGIVMVGMASAVFGLARQSYLVELVPYAYRARALSTLGGVMRIGYFIGPFVSAAAIHQFGLRGAFGVGIVAMLVASMVAASIPDLPPAPAADPVRPASGAASLRAIAIAHRRVFLTLGLGVLLVSAVRSSRQAVIPLWADHLGIEPAFASLIYGLGAGIDVLVFYPAGHVMDRRGRAWVAVPSMLIMGVALFLMPFTMSAGGLVATALLLGFGNGLGSGVIMTLGADHSPSPGRAHFLGLWRLISDVGTFSGPALLSGITAGLGLMAGIWSTGLLGFGAALALGYWIPRAAAALQRQRSASSPARAGST